MSFIFERTELPGVITVTPDSFTDNRGHFFETYKMSEFMVNGIEEVFVQDNQSYSKKGVLRGIHFQKVPCAQGKLVRCLRGRIWDVAVDLRPESSTFKRWVGVELDSRKNNMLYIPPEFGHGFSVLSEEGAEISYKCTYEYDPDADTGLIWNDAELDIDWKIENPLISDKDSRLPTLKEYFML